MHIVIENKLINLKEANTFKDKLLGLMFKKNIDYALKLKCNGIHTFFMREKIDVVLCDKDNNVLYIYKNLKKNRIIFPKRKVYYTYEFPCETIKNNFKKIEVRSN